MNEPQEDFRAYFAREIAPALEIQESARRKAVLKHNVTLGIGLGAGAVLIVLAATGASGAPTPALFVGVFLALIGAVVISRSFVKHVANGVKDTMIPKVAGFAGARYARQVPDVSAVQVFRAQHLVPSFHRSSYEDQVAGERAGCTFVLFEAHLQQRHKDSKGRTSYTTVFRGQLLNVAAPQRFLGRTIVLRDAGLFNALRGVGGGLERVRLVDPKFEKTFEVYSTDQVEARYLLTPTFMERLLALESLLRGRKARAGFVDGALLVAIEGQNLFEAGSMFAPLVDYERAARVLADIEGVHAVIDALLAAKGADNLTS